MREAVLSILVSNVWGLFDIINLYIIFNFFIGEEKKVNKENVARNLFIYFSIGIIYSIVIIPDYNKFLLIISFILFYLRNVIIVKTFFEKRNNVTAMVIFYEVIISNIGQNVDYFIGNSLFTEMSVLVRSNIMDMSITIAVFLVLVVLYNLNRFKVIDIYLATLPTQDYIILSAVFFILGSVHSLILDGHNVHVAIQLIFVSMKFLIYVLAARMIVVNKHNFSINSAIVLVQEEMAHLTNYYNDLNEKNLEMRKFRHDNQNMLLIIQSMIMEGKNEQALEYIRKMQDMQANTKACVETGNFIADALISSKQKYAKQNDIDLTYTGFIPSDKLDDIEMTIVLSNLIDNAIEACAKQTGQQTITIESVYQKNLWVLAIKNPIEKEVKIRNNHISTSKSNKKIHGLGIMNVKSVVNKYKGRFSLESTENLFTAKIIIEFGNYN